MNLASRKKVLIIDSGMRNLGGHNFSYTRAVQAALEKRGISVTVFANKHLASGLAEAFGYRPVFSFGAYDYPAGNGPLRDLIYLYSQSVIYSDELERALKQIPIEDYALVFCHTVNDFELIGWNRYLWRHKLPGHLTILLRQTPRFYSCSRLKLLVHPYWRIKPYYLNAIHAKLGNRFVLLTDSEPLSEDYARVYRHRIVTLPIPINGFIFSADSDVAISHDTIHMRYGLTRGGGICIGYMGDARAAKGFLLLPELIRRVLADTSVEAKFIIQCPNSASGYDNGQPANGVAELRGLAQQAGDRVILIPERLSERDYADLLRYLDIVLIPYLDAKYAEATSGIFAEALALSKPVVVPSNTWMARELSRSGGGVEFRSGNIDDLTAKVLQLIHGYEEYASKAQRFSSGWKRFHNPHSLVDILLRANQLDSIYRP